MPDAEGKYWTPATVIWDVPSNFGGYVPLNYDRLYHGPETLRSALANSLNVPAVKTLNNIGLLRFTEVATEMGLQFPLGNPVERNAGLPTALGAVEVRLFDMVRAYATLANSGHQVTPYSIVRIEDSKGNLVYEAKPNEEVKQIVPPEYAYLITSILSDNEARAPEFGRGWPMELQNGRIAAVKTGTTDDSRDIWTLGYTPQFAVGVWVGNSDNRPMYSTTGYYGAAPIWNEVMESAHAGLAVQQFEQPPNLIQVEVCNDSGAQPSQYCAGRTHWDIFAASAPPPGPDKDIFRKLQVDGYTNKLVNEYCPDDVEERMFVSIDDPFAYDWINNTGEGNTWATSRGIDVPVMPPPTEYCDPNQPRPTVVISFPPDNMTGAEGTLPIRGQVSMPDFNRYEIRYGVSHDPEAFSQPLAVETVQQPNADSPLAQIDTRQLENGPYTIRLTAIDNFGRSVTRDVRITVNNPAPTAQPTSMPTPTLAPSLTPGAGGATPEPGNILPQPTAAPTLTPTWTLTPTPQ
jgi:membrane peptidoglycan carboxypeptidase